VNQIRFFSSSALAKAPKLMLAANCSAAETIFKAFSRRPSPASRPYRCGRAALSGVPRR
jgi:hypothetical protein